MFLDCFPGTGAYYPVTMLGDSGQPELKNYDLSQNGQNGKEIPYHYTHLLGFLILQ